MTTLTHVDESGAARMVDVSGKAVTTRIAVATGRIDMNKAARSAIAEGKVAKGDTLAVARVAGIMAAKKTAELIPLCHPLALSAVEVALDVDKAGVACTATVRLDGKTGVEMEALTAVSTALLTVYDMAKAIDKEMVIRDIRLVEKRGGKSGDWTA